MAHLHLLSQPHIFEAARAHNQLGCTSNELKKKKRKKKLRMLANKKEKVLKSHLQVADSIQPLAKALHIESLSMWEQHHPLTS